MSKERVHFEVEESLLDQFDRLYENRSEEIRRLMRWAVARDTDQLDSETLASAYGILLDHGRRYDNGAIRVVAGDIAPVIANQCNVEGGIDAVKARVFRELRKQGFIKPRSGFLWVKPEGADPEEWGET